MVPHFLVISIDECFALVKLNWLTLATRRITNYYNISFISFLESSSTCCSLWSPLNCILVGASNLSFYHVGFISCTKNSLSLSIITYWSLSAIFFSSLILLFIMRMLLDPFLKLSDTQYLCFFYPRKSIVCRLLHDNILPTQVAARLTQLTGAILYYVFALEQFKHSVWSEEFEVPQTFQKLQLTSIYCAWSWIPTSMQQCTQLTISSAEKRFRLALINLYLCVLFQ